MHFLNSRKTGFLFRVSVGFSVRIHDYIFSDNCTIKNTKPENKKKGKKVLTKLFCLCRRAVTLSGMNIDFHSGSQERLPDSNCEYLPQYKMLRECVD